MFLLIIILLHIFAKSNGQITPIITECSITNRGWCEFRNIRTTEENPLFQPGTSTSRKISRIFFTDSQMPVLTSEICSSFPELRRLDIEQVTLTALHNKSIEKCTRLQYISFFNNNLRTIDRDTFKRNTGLQFISLSWNKITHIDMSTFSHLYVLEELALDNNRITIIDFRLIGELARMSILHVGSNQLIELNEKIIVKRFPALQKIYVEDNLFPCSRVQGIIDELTAFNVTLGKGLSYKRSDVHFERKVMQGIDCLEARAYNEMLSTRFDMEVEADHVTPVEEEQNYTCWYIGGGIAIILFLIIIVLCGCLYWRRRRNLGVMPNGDYYYGYAVNTQKSEAPELVY